MRRYFSLTVVFFIFFIFYILYICYRLTIAVEYNIIFPQNREYEEVCSRRAKERAMRDKRQVNVFLERVRDKSLSLRVSQKPGEYITTPDAKNITFS